MKINSSNRNSTIENLLKTRRCLCTTTTHVLLTWITEFLSVFVGDSL